VYHCWWLQTGRQKFQDRSRGFSSIYASPIEQAFNLQNNTPKGHSLWIHESSCSECMEWSKIQCLLIREKLCLDPATLATDIASTTRCATDWAEHRPRHGPCRTLLRSCLSESCADHWELTWVNLGYPWLSNVCFSPFFCRGGITSYLKNELIAEYLSFSNATRVKRACPVDIFGLLKLLTPRAVKVGQPCLGFQFHGARLVI
jgi:hypothetical protein